MAAPDLLARTADLVSVASESFQEAELVARIEAELRELDHLEVTRIGDNLVGRTDHSTGRRLVLAGHTDTVPANGNAVPKVDGDVLWGVGSADMKGGLAVMLESASRHTDPAVDVTYVFYAREEVASEHSGLAELLAARPDLLVGDLALLGEPTDGAIEAGCQGSVRVRVTLAGRRAHTARAWMGRNAIHRLGDLLERCIGRTATRVVDENVDAAQFGDRGTDGVVALRQVGHVHLQRHHAPAHGDDPALHLSGGG